MSLFLALARNLVQRLTGRGTPHPGDLVERAAEADARGDHTSSERLCRQAIEAEPEAAAGWMNLGLSLQFQGRTGEALDALRRAVALDPASSAAQYNLGRLHHAEGRFDAAVPALAQAVAAEPSFVDALILLADARAGCGDGEGAVRDLRAALEVDPAHPGALHNAALLLYRTGAIDETVRLYRRALASAPASAEAAIGLSPALAEIGEVAEAVDVARRALAAHPSSGHARVVYLFGLLLDDRITAGHVAAEHRRVGALFEAEAPARTRPFANAREPGRRLRVGYLSGDLHAHSCSLFLEHILERHDRSSVAAIAYSTSTIADEYTERMRAQFERWRDVAGIDDAALARRIEADGVDVLVDLAGYTSASRMGVFARRPAPVQVTWFAYIGTSGLEAMTHRLTDAVLDPPGESERYSTETLVRLPRSLWSYRPPREAMIEVAAAERAEGPPRFGSFNRYAKVSATTMKLWCALLRSLPDATLSVLTVPRGEAQRALLARFAAEGIAPARIRLLPRLDQPRYYAAYRDVDVCLDTTPYSGATTTCDALWMGVPLVTLSGATPVSRSAASILTHSGFESWIAHGADDYVGLAAKLARESRADQQRRAAVRERFRASSLMDEAGYTRDVEIAYRAMWRDWCGRETR